MAVWQFALIPIPAAAAKVTGVDAIRLDDAVLSNRHWDLPRDQQQILFAALSALLPEATGWCADMRIWGDIKRNDNIQIFFDRADIASIEFRLDVSRLSMPLVDGICALARERHWVFVSESGAVIQPTREAMVRAIAQSPAQKFVRGAADYLA